jgi:purine-nucleoside phosphorylase
MSGRVPFITRVIHCSCGASRRALKMLGVKNLIVTNAAGGINKSFNKGDIMLIKKTISACFCPNPLLGANIDRIGGKVPR